MTNDSRVRARAGIALALALLLAAFAWPALAQTDSTGVTDSTLVPPAPVQSAPRASWLSDRMPLRPGDLVTVVVDEQTAARERVSRVADGNRSTNNRLRADLPSSAQAFNIQSGIIANSRDVGEAGRTGDLTAVLTVSVIAVEPGGALRIKGSRKVTVDGRLQTITLEGQVRGEDVDAANRVLSSRIADAIITYKGGKIGPRTGIMGKLLGMLWP
jgi:flagellar L-ring protein precursor FlgH